MKDTSELQSLTATLWPNIVLFFVVVCIVLNHVIFASFRGQ